MIIQAIRSFIFYFLFLAQTCVLAILLGTISVFATRYMPFGLAIGKYWGTSNLFLLRWVVGIRTEVTGLENLPDGACIIASKHQSDWDVFAILPYTTRPAFIAKKELMDIPFFGWAARSLETITIDRKRGGDSSIPEMNESARRAVDRGCQIVIFPEGTRSAALTTARYKVGASRMYEATGVPIVPVAVNSGLFWGRNSLILWPGTARAQFLPPIPEGLRASQAHARMIAEIESASNALALKAADDGISRPLSPQMQARLAELRQEAK